MIHSLRLQQFRSYADDSFEFDEHVNIIVGPNASGKTNLLEAILCAATGSSYRTKDLGVIAFDADWARIDMRDDAGLRIMKLQKNPDSSRALKTFELMGVSKKRLQLRDTLPVVVFEPNHLQLLTGSPERRRDFLDGILMQTQADFRQLKRAYEKTLAQRNALLKRGMGMQNQLFAWNIRLSELGGRVASQRIALCKELNTSIEALYQDISGSTRKVQLGYKTMCSLTHYGSDMLKKLERSEADDFHKGFTSFGPHRDDMEVVFDAMPLSDIASRGEVRTLLLALKILELRLIEQTRDSKPILLLDDVFSELDGARRRALTAFLKGHQTFITTTDADIVVKHFTESSHIIPL